MGKSNFIDLRRFPERVHTQGCDQASGALIRALARKAKVSVYLFHKQEPYILWHAHLHKLCKKNIRFSLSRRHKLWEFLATCNMSFRIEEHKISMQIVFTVMTVLVSSLLLCAAWYQYRATTETYNQHSPVLPYPPCAVWASWIHSRLWGGIGMHCSALPRRTGWIDWGGFLPDWRFW